MSDEIQEPQEDLIEGVPPSIETVAGKETPQEALVRAFDQNMDTMVAAIKNCLRVTILLTEKDPEFAPRKESIKDFFGRGVIPFLEDIDNQMFSYTGESKETTE